MLKGYTKDEFFKLMKANDIMVKDVAEACGRSRQMIHLSFDNCSKSNQLFYSLVLDRLIEEKRKKGEKVYKVIEG